MPGPESGSIGWCGLGGVGVTYFAGVGVALLEVCHCRGGL